MTITLVVLDTNTNVGPVLDTAHLFAELTASNLEVVLAPRSMDVDRNVQALLDEADVPVRRLKGPRGPALDAAVSDPEVLAVVVAARRERSRRYPVGPIVRTLLEQTLKPVLVVPPDVAAPSALQRLLIPLDGAESSSRAVLDQLLPLCAKPVELIVLHVFTDSTLPVMLDRPARDLEILGKEFLRRHLPHVHHIELSLGPTGQRVCEVSSEQGSDLVVLSWSQDTSPGRALVIQEVLSSASLPVLLLPTLERLDASAHVADRP
jgi:nucleotide-binding universal stress UspA family protein